MDDKPKVFRSFDELYKYLRGRVKEMEPVKAKPAKKEAKKDEVPAK